MSGLPLAPVPPMPAAAPAPARQAATLHQTAQRFEAMFLGEMIRLSRPQPDPANPFSPGQGEQMWGSFMDEALGQAMAAGGGTGLAKQIEQALARSGAAPGASRP